MGGRFTAELVDSDGVALWARALAVDPDNNSARIAIGKSYFGQGDLESARTLFEEALRRDPEDFEANRMWAVTMLELERRANPR